MSNSEPISTELLKGFTKSDDPILKNILRMWNPKAWSRDQEVRLIAKYGQQAYDDRNWDAVVCDRSIMIRIPCWKHPESWEAPLGFAFPVTWLWCLDQIRQNIACAHLPEAALSRIHPDHLAKLQQLPDLQFWEVSKVHFTRHGKGRPKHKTQAPPPDVLFFTFSGGEGVVVAERKRRAS